MAGEVVVTPPTPGGGRIADLVWPSRRVSPWAGVSANVDVRNSSYNGQNAMATQTNGSAGTNAWAVYQGVDCVKMTANATVGQGSSYVSGDTMRCHVRTTKGHPFPSSCADYAVYRTYIVAAFPYTPAQDSDMGYELTPMSNGSYTSIISGGTDGIGFTRGADGHIYLIIRAGGVLRKYALDGAAGFDPTLFHSYELRITSATRTAEASLKCLVDGTLVQTFNWGAGSILPLSNNANPGFAAGLWALEGGNGYHYIESFRVIYGPTEQSTL